MNNSVSSSNIWKQVGTGIARMRVNQLEDERVFHEIVCHIGSRFMRDCKNGSTAAFCR